MLGRLVVKMIFRPCARTTPSATARKRCSFHWSREFGAIDPDRERSPLVGIRSKGIIHKNAVALETRRNAAHGILMNHYLDLVIASGLLFNAITLANAQGVAPSELPETTCFHQTPFRIPKNKLLNFDSASRVPNTYIVGFNCDKALSQNTTNSAAHRSQVLPDTLPTSPANCVALASAYVARFGGSVVTVWCSPGGLRAFFINGISEAAIADLAQDDRVEYVEPDMYATTS